MKIWDADSGEEVRTLTLVGHRGMMHSLTALPDGKLDREEDDTSKFDAGSFACPALS